MTHGLIKLADSSSNSDAAHRRALHDKTAKQNRFGLLHNGEEVTQPVQDLVAALNGFNGQIDPEQILWRTEKPAQPGMPRPITYRNIEVASLLIPLGIHINGRRIGSFSNDSTNLSNLKRNPDVQAKMKIGNLNDVISILRSNSGDNWDLRTLSGSTYIRLNQKPLYLVSPTFEIKAPKPKSDKTDETNETHETIADLNEGTKGDPEKADVYGVAEKILAHYLN